MMEDNELYLMATLLSVLLILNGQKDNRVIKKWQFPGPSGEEKT